MSEQRKIIPSMIVDEFPPAEIFAAQKKKEDNKEQEYFAEVLLFFSFDIVNSTMYKNMTVKWPIVMTELLEYIRKRVESKNELDGASLWRVIGDEMIFVLSVRTQAQLNENIEAIFEITQAVSMVLKCGDFFLTISSTCKTNSSWG